jgi:ribonuclease BN (tRNA processing enzyme)
MTITFAGSGDAFASGGRFQACIHVRASGQVPVLLDCGATSLTALRRCGLEPGEVAAVFDQAARLRTNGNWIYEECPIAW